MKPVGFTHDSKQNKTQDWYTPAWIFERLGLTFDLDPCTCPGGVPWIPAKKVYSKAQDGLVQPWAASDLVWLNPPYGADTPKWLARMHAHRRGIALLFARTDTRWFHAYCAKADAICFLPGRIAFVDGFGLTGGGGAGAGSMLIAWGEPSVSAISRFDGLLVRPSA